MNTLAKLAGGMHILQQPRVLCNVEEVDPKVAVAYIELLCSEGRLETAHDMLASYVPKIEGHNVLQSRCFVLLGQWKDALCEERFHCDSEEWVRYVSLEGDVV